MNSVNLIGRLTRDPEQKGSGETIVTRYTLAVNRMKEGADFINIVAFGKAGEFAKNYFRKGLQVGVTGRIQTGSYTDKDGKKHSTFDVVAEKQDFADSKRESFEETKEEEGDLPF